MVTRANIVLPTLPRESVAVPALGGDVTVRGLLLRDRLALFAGLRDDGTTYSHMARLLALCVVGDDDQPLLNEQEWEIFGSADFETALQLFAVVRRLAGLDAEVVEKN